jgi:RNA polymerase sigma-70 factor (ECF subfamily)
LAFPSLERSLPVPPAGDVTGTDQIMPLPCLQGKHHPAAAVAGPPRGLDDRWGVLYRTHGRAVYARCKRLLGDRHAAEDAAQETFARAHRHVTSLLDPEHQRRWLFRVATNYCLNQLRDRKRRGELLLLLRTDELDEAPPNLVERAAAASVVRWVPDRVRSVAWLSYVDDMDQHQVAETLGISRRTVVNRLAEFREHARRARARMGET